MLIHSVCARAEELPTLKHNSPVAPCPIHGENDPCAARDDDAHELSLQDMLSRAVSVTGDERDDRCYMRPWLKEERSNIYVYLSNSLACATNNTRD